MKKIGFTGGIGSGKTTAAQLFSEMFKIPLIDADALSKEASEKIEVIKKIKNTFGLFCMDDNQINREKLAQIVFNDAEKLKKLNAIIHPVVMREYKKQCRAFQTAGNDYVIFDCPLLIDENLQNSVDVTVLIYADKKSRIERIIKRNDFTYNEIINRIDAQMDLDEKIDLSDIVIYNDGSLDDLKNALKYLYNEVCL